jgi:hypothetical protein
VTQPEAPPDVVPAPAPMPQPTPQPSAAATPADNTASDTQPKLPLAPTGGTAPPLEACAVKAFDEYAVAMSVWEREWAEGVIDARPDFKNAVIERGNAHNSALQRDGFRIHYLAANVPDNLDVDESIASMRLFDWTQTQEQTLRLTQSNYATVADAAEHDRQLADADPKSEELEIYFEESFTDNNGAGSARNLAKLLNQGNSALEFCREHNAVEPPSAVCPDCYSGPTASAPPAPPPGNTAPASPPQPTPAPPAQGPLIPPPGTPPPPPLSPPPSPGAP